MSNDDALRHFRVRGDRADRSSHGYGCDVPVGVPDDRGNVQLVEPRDRIEGKRFDELTFARMMKSRTANVTS